MKGGKSPVHYPNFDLLRLILSLMVVYSHSLALTDTDWYQLPFGAVPTFLAISGVLVLQSFEVDPRWRFFAYKRFLRIAPALFASFAFCLVFLGYYFFKGSLIVYLSGSLIYPDYEKNFALWSLLWEEVAYFLMVVLWLSGAYKRKIAIWGLLIASLLLTWWMAHLPPHRKIILFLYPAFFVGNLAYLYRSELTRVHPTIPWIVFFLLWQWGETEASTWFGGAAIAVVHAFMFVWVGMAGVRILPFRFPDISYGAYIYHLPVIYFLFQLGVPRSMPLLLVALVPTLLVTCLLSWYFIEKPALKLKHLRFNRSVVAAE